MSLDDVRRCISVLSFFLVFWSAGLDAEPQASPSSLSPSTNVHLSRSKQGVGHLYSPLDAGTVVNGVYRNKTFGFTCKIPAGWVMRTDEMNAQEEGTDLEANDRTSKEEKSQPQGPQRDTEAERKSGGKVLLAAFSRPPEAHGEEVNASIVIAAEPTATYPGLKEAGQYFEPLTEVAKAQGFVVDAEPYEIAIGTKTLVRSDFHKDVGTRVMRQSTLAMLIHGYAVSITVIAGTDEEVEELIDGLSFATGRK